MSINYDIDEFDPGQPLHIQMNGVKMVMTTNQISMKNMKARKIGLMDTIAIVKIEIFGSFGLRRTSSSSRNSTSWIMEASRGAKIATTVTAAHPVLGERTSLQVITMSVQKSKRAMNSSMYSRTAVTSALF